MKKEKTKTKKEKESGHGCIINHIAVGRNVFSLNQYFNSIKVYTQDRKLITQEYLDFLKAIETREYIERYGEAGKKKK